MDKRACIYIRVGWLCMAAFALLIASRYVAQQRIVSLGFCPPSQTAPYPRLLMFDTLGLETFCIPLPHDKTVFERKPDRKQEL